MELPPKDSHNKILMVALAVVGLAVAAIFLQPAVQEKLAPELVTSWVAIEVDGAGVADVGPVTIPAGTRFTLHAVVEARDRQGRPVYYTLAPALSLAGEPVAAGRLRRWDRSPRVTLRWFTVEGAPPYVELASGEDLERWAFQDLYRADWPLAWSIPGNVDPAHDDYLADGEELNDAFGTLRYQVSVEIYGLQDEILPAKRLQSWGAAEVRREAARFPTVHLLLPGNLGPASKVFGLSQLEPSPGAPRELQKTVSELASEHLAFSSLTVLLDQIRAAGGSLDDLTWESVDLVEAAAPWDERIQPGDLLRAGERTVVLYEDRGEPGVLDYEDLCFDYAQGAAVRRLADVFAGDGVVEVAHLGGGT